MGLIGRYKPTLLCPADSLGVGRYHTTDECEEREPEQCDVDEKQFVEWDLYGDASPHVGHVC